MLKHRANIGFHFIGNLKRKVGTEKKQVSKAIIHPRYPINTMLATLFVPALFIPYGWLLFTIGLLLNNLRFSLFMFKNHGIIHSVLVFPITFMEGLAFTLGVGKGILHEFISYRKTPVG